MEITIVARAYPYFIKKYERIEKKRYSDLLDGKTAERIINVLLETNLVEI